MKPQPDKNFSQKKPSTVRTAFIAQNQAAVNGRRINWFTTLSNHSNRPRITRYFFRDRIHNTPPLNIVALDTSGSTLSHTSLEQAKGVAAGIANHAYRARERLALISFGNNQVQTVISAQRAPKSIIEFLDSLPAGGGTPLRKALLQVQQLINQSRRKHAATLCRVYFLTDARSSDDISGIELDAQVFIIDTEQRPVPLARAVNLSKELSATYLQLQSLPIMTINSKAPHDS